MAVSNEWVVSFRIIKAIVKSPARPPKSSTFRAFPLPIRKAAHRSSFSCYIAFMFTVYVLGRVSKLLAIL